MSAPLYTPSAEWRRHPERGSVPLVRFMAWASLRLGRRLSRAMLYPIVAYFFCTAARARQGTCAYLRRALGREPRLREVWRVFFNFATTIHDRVYFLMGRFDLFEIEQHGTELFDESGAFLLGAHLGSFEAMRAVGRGLAHRRVVIAMYEENARRLNAILAAIEPSAAQDIIGLGHVDSMLELTTRLEAGDLVGMLADRTLGAEATTRVPFLGEEAAFPLGPMRIAAALRRRVLFMAGLYRGANRYEMHFEPLADFSDLDGADRAERERRVQEAVREYARRLEAYCRRAPDNWFNFYDFWGRP